MKIKFIGTQNATNFKGPFVHPQAPLNLKEPWNLGEVKDLSDANGGYLLNKHPKQFEVDAPKAKAKNKMAAKPTNTKKVEL